MFMISFLHLWRLTSTALAVVGFLATTAICAPTPFQTGSTRLDRCGYIRQNCGIEKCDPTGGLEGFLACASQCEDDLNKVDNLKNLGCFNSLEEGEKIAEEAVKNIGENKDDQSFFETEETSSDQPNINPSVIEERTIATLLSGDFSSPTTDTKYSSCEAKHQICLSPCLKCIYKPWEHRWVCPPQNTTIYIPSNLFCAYRCNHIFNECVEARETPKIIPIDNPDYEQVRLKCYQQCYHCKVKPGQKAECPYMPTDIKLGYDNTYCISKCKNIHKECIRAQKASGKFARSIHESEDSHHADKMKQDSEKSQVDQIGISARTAAINPVVTGPYEDSESISCKAGQLACNRKCFSSQYSIEVFLTRKHKSCVSKCQKDYDECHRVHGVATRDIHTQQELHEYKPLASTEQAQHNGLEIKKREVEYTQIDSSWKPKWVEEPPKWTKWRPKWWQWPPKSHRLDAWIGSSPWCVDNRGACEDKCKSGPKELRKSCMDKCWTTYLDCYKHNSNGPDHPSKGENENSG